MSIFGPDFETYLRTPEKRGLPDNVLMQHMGDIWAPSSAGVPVSSSTAYGLSTWWGAVSLISWSVARPRMRPFSLAPNDIRRYEDGHPVSRLLNVQPNKNMTALVFRRVLTAHVLVYGNAYAEIEWDNAGRARALWPLVPTEIEPVIRNGELVYLSRGTFTGLRGEDVLHIQGLGFDGLKGYSVLSMARQSLALGLAAQQFGATFFGNGAFPALLASTDQKLEQPQRDRIRESWNALHQGPDRAHRLAVLEGGLKVEKLTIPPDDAQFLETRQFQREEICAYFNLNPAMLGYNAGNAPGGNYEAQKISYVSDTIGPWWRAWEQEVERKLIGPGPRQVEHDAEELLQYLSMNETRLKNKAAAARLRRIRSSGRHGRLWASPDALREARASRGARAPRPRGRAPRGRPRPRGGHRRGAAGAYRPRRRAACQDRGGGGPQGGREGAPEGLGGRVLPAPPCPPGAVPRARGPVDPSPERLARGGRNGGRRDGRPEHGRPRGRRGRGRTRGEPLGNRTAVRSGWPSHGGQIDGRHRTADRGRGPRGPR